MERRHLQCIFVFCTQNLSEIIIWKCKASFLYFQFGLISLEDVTLVIDAGKRLWTIEERIAVPSQQYVISLVGCSPLQHLVVVQPVCAHAPLNLHVCSPGSCWKGCIRERRMLLVCQVRLTGKGEELLVWIIWHVRKNRECCSEGFFMVLPWDNLCRPLGIQNPWENGFHSDTC